MWSFDVRYINAELLNIAWVTITVAKLTFVYMIYSKYYRYVMGFYTYMTYGISPVILALYNVVISYILPAVLPGHGFTCAPVPAGCRFCSLVNLLGDEYIWKLQMQSKF